MLEQLITVYDLTITFVEPLLGTQPLDEEAYLRVHGQAAQGDELELLSEEEAEVAEQGPITGFLRQNGQPLLMNYMVKGFFKEACSALRRVEGSRSRKFSAHRKKIDTLLFVEPRRLLLQLPAGGEIRKLGRSLRARTPQGERIAVAVSELVPAGTQLSCELHLLGEEISEKLLREWLDYGQLHGLGQWRNADYGRFTYSLSRRQS